MFLDQLISKAEEEILHQEDKHSAGLAHKKPKCFYPYSQACRQQQDSEWKTGQPAWKQLKKCGQNRTSRGKASNYQQRLPKGRRIINDNFCVNCVAGKKDCVHVIGKVNYCVNCVAGKKDCVHVTSKVNSLNVVTERAVQKDCLFVTSKRETVHSPFPVLAKLTRSPTIISCYVNPHRNLYLLEALHQFLNKNTVELVTTPASLSFYKSFFLVQKPITTGGDLS